jgi:putative transposase
MRSRVGAVREPPASTGEPPASIREPPAPIREPPPSGHRHHRRSIRLRGWDYASPGAYSVTLCTQDRVALFGEVRDGHMHLSDLGAIVADAWQWLSAHYAHIALDAWCVMPNHLHGILIIRTGGPHDGQTPQGGTPAKPIGQVIGAFKTVSTKHINLARRSPGATVWQRNFWEHIVRDGDEMDRIRAYIRDNPLTWSLDDLNAPAPRTARGQTST